MADAVDADSDSLAASKAIYNAKLEPIKKINAFRTEARDYWTANTFFYPEPGKRLLPRDQVEEFNAHMTDFESRLALLAADVQGIRSEIIEDARPRLGKA